MLGSGSIELYIVDSLLSGTVVPAEQGGGRAASPPAGALRSVEEPALMLRCFCFFHRKAKYGSHSNLQPNSTDFCLRSDLVTNLQNCQANGRRECCGQGLNELLLERGS